MPSSAPTFMDAAVGYLKTAAIQAAVALDLFTAIAQEDGDLDRVAARTGASKRGVRILVRLPDGPGFPAKERRRIQPHTIHADVSNHHVPSLDRSIVHFLCSPEMTTLFLDDPASFVRKGGSVGLGNLAPDHPAWVKFARAMVPFMRPTAGALADGVARLPAPPKRVLDIAAGHGVFGISVAQAVPQAEITAVDWQAVLEVADENARAAGISDRYRTVPGSAFEVYWGRDFDLVLLTNFLHHFDQETCIKLLEKARNSLSDDGRVIAVDFVPNPDSVSPSFAAMFPFVMLGSTPHGDAYTAREYEEMGRAAGFEAITIAPVPPTPQSFITFSKHEAGE